MDTSIIKPKDWSKLLILISLDGIMPLFEEIGLYVQNKNNFVQLLRESILENRNHHKVESEKPEFRLPFFFLKKLEITFGKQEALKFYKWAITSFLGDHADQPDWSAWEILFSNWAYGSGQVLSELAPEKQDKLLTGYRKIISTDEIEKIIYQLKSRPLTDWDLEMYTRHGFDNTDEFSDPYSTIIWMAKIRKLQDFWSRARTILSEDEKKFIYKQGQEMVQKLGIWMPSPLQGLDSLWEKLCLLYEINN